jgi:hypothetical protein
MIMCNVLPTPRFVERWAVLEKSFLRADMPFDQVRDLTDQRK